MCSREHTQKHAWRRTKLFIQSCSPWRDFCVLLCMQKWWSFLHMSYTPLSLTHSLECMFRHFLSKLQVDSLHVTYLNNKQCKNEWKSQVSDAKWLVWVAKEFFLAKFHLHFFMWKKYFFPLKRVFLLFIKLHVKHFMLFCFYFSHRSLAFPKRVGKKSQREIKINEYIESIILKHRSTVTERREEWDEGKIRKNTHKISLIIFKWVREKKNQWSDNDEGWEEDQKFIFNCINKTKTLKTL